MGKVGSIAPNCHEGSRSEYLAQYVFSSFGTAVAIPHQEDHGLDLYCTFMERVGNRAWTKSPYTIQVKSEMKPWVFDGQESVKWLIEHPLPLFLCVVDKESALLSVYHTAPRFYTWCIGEIPDKLIMIPETNENGRSTQWTGSYELSLSAPILKIDVNHLGDDDYWQNARTVLEKWIEVENYNLTLIRSGLLRFKMPAEYTTNNSDFRGRVEQGRTRPSTELFERGIVHLSECLDCLGSQFYYSGKLLSAVEAGMLYQNMRQQFPQFFNNEIYSPTSFTNMFSKLTNALPNLPNNHVAAGIEEIQRKIEEIIKNIK